MSRLLFAALCAGAAVALADVPPPDLGGCSGKTAGASCQKDDGSAGTCADSTCTRNDYSEGPPPKQVDYPCLKCVAGAAPTPTSPPPEKKSGSCAVAPGPGLAALALLLARRRA
jgi:hypothetical protein